MATKLHGRAFYEALGSPKLILAPMVDMSEFAWRILTRSFLPAEDRGQILAYTPMLHARLFVDNERYRAVHFPAAQNLDGRPGLDRPLFVQFCANEPDVLLQAALLVAPHCDAVDLNLGCPQGIARRGRYGAFLQDDLALVARLVERLHRALPVPVTAKIRILDTREATLAYARTLLSAGASILTVHGRRREQKGHLTGLADWAVIRYLRDNLPPDTVLFANGNVLQHADLARCLAATGADAVMSAEGNLSNPALFASPPPVGATCRDYWRPSSSPSSSSPLPSSVAPAHDGGGWRVDAIMRRYLDILHTHVLGTAAPTRRPLFLPGDDTVWMAEQDAADAADATGPRARKRRRTDGLPRPPQQRDCNLDAMQGHMFRLLHALVSRHTDVRDCLAAGRSDIARYEAALRRVERIVARGLLQHHEQLTPAPESEPDLPHPAASSAATVAACRRPLWIAQPAVRPLPEEALAKGSIQPGKKLLRVLAQTAATADGDAPAPLPSSRQRTRSLSPLSALALGAAGVMGGPASQRSEGNAVQIVDSG